MDAYCMKCKKKRMINDGKESRSKTGMKVVKGTCCNCGTKVSRIIGK